MQGSWREPVAVDPHAEVASKARRLRLERQCIQEQRKLDKLNSPMQMIEDAMKMVSQAERCAKLANDSKVARWAADLSTASAESIARSASSGGLRVETVASSVSFDGKNSVSKESLEKKGKKPFAKEPLDVTSFAILPLNAAERVAMLRGVMTKDQVVQARKGFNRALIPHDFIRDDFPYPINKRQRDAIFDSDLHE